jgi:Recombination endonuclease VII
MSCIHCPLPVTGNRHGLCGRHLYRLNRYGDPLVEGVPTRATAHEEPQVTRLARYGLSLDDFGRLWEVQEGRCAICRTGLDQATRHIDHDHITSLVRGLLCRLCNLGLGMFADDTARLAAAILYLRLLAQE